MATRRQSNRSPRPLKPFGYHRPRRAQATCAKGTDYKDLMRMALRLSSSLSRRMGDPGPDRRTDRLRRHQLRRACPESSPSDDPGRRYRNARRTGAGEVGCGPWSRLHGPPYTGAETLFRRTFEQSVRQLRALLAGDEVEIDGSAARMLHTPGFAS